MQQICVEDFQVDKACRRVTHKSGAQVSFDPHPTEEIWLRSDTCKVRKSSTFDGSYLELASFAKKAALLHGMKHR